MCTPIKGQDEEWASLDLSRSCSFTLLGKHYIVGGHSENHDAMAGYRNFEVDLQNNKLIRLPNLPMNFNGGSCASYDFQEDWEPSEGGEAVLCSSLHYSGIPDLIGRECFKFDGETYGMIWYTNKNHIGGNMVSWPSVRGFYNIGGGEYEDNLFHFESWAGSKLGGYDGYWNIDYSSDDPKLVTLTGFTVIRIPYQFRQMILMSRTRNFLYYINYVASHTNSLQIWRRNHDLRRL